MKEIIIPIDSDYIDDIKRIVKVLLDKNIICSEQNAQFLWSEYSDGMAAGWMSLPREDEDVFNCIAYQVNKYLN